MNPASNVFLIGPMGAGKSSIGRQLAQRLGLGWCDLDAAIEARTGTRIATIFELEGEAGFRRREAAVLDELSAREGIVLATGGGAILAPGNQTILKTRGFVVWLDTTVEQQLQRLARDHDRPLLQAPDRRERLTRLAQERDPIYRALADLVIASADETSQRTTARIVAALQTRWQRVPTAKAHA